MKNIISVLVFFVLVFCPALSLSREPTNDDFIRAVTDATFAFDESLTIGQAFETYKYFYNSRWEFGTDERGRLVVTFFADYDLELELSDIKDEVSSNPFGEIVLLPILAQLSLERGIIVGGNAKVAVQFYIKNDYSGIGVLGAYYWFKESESVFQFNNTEEILRRIYENGYLLYYV